MASEAYSDADLSRRCRQGDSQAWRQLIKQFSPIAYRVAVRFFGFGPEAEDAAQETFMRVHRSFHTFDPSRPLKPWISRIAYNVCLKRLGKAGRAITDTTDPQDFARFQDQRSIDPEGSTQSVEAGRLVVTAMQQLPAQDRVLLDLHYREGLALAEVSEATGMPVNTIKTRMHRARTKLRAILAPKLREGQA